MTEPDLPSITDGITDAEAEASGTFDLTIDEVRSNSRYLDAIDENARLRRELAAANLRAETAEAEVALEQERTEQAKAERDSWRTEAKRLQGIEADAGALELAKRLEARTRVERDELRARLDGLGEEWGLLGARCATYTTRHVGDGDYGRGEALLQRRHTQTLMRRLVGEWQHADATPVDAAATALSATLPVSQDAEGSRVELEYDSPSRKRPEVCDTSCSYPACTCGLGTGPYVAKETEA